jgi:DNA-binding NtrC family response regulator
MGDIVRILLVDDEPALLRLMQTYLNRLGYDVEACSDAKSALEVFESKSFDLVVADVTLPDRSGQDMAIEMANEDPKLRVLVCSGYPVQMTSIPAGTRERFASLQKPFLPNMLASTIEGLLRKRS